LVVVSFFTLGFAVGSWSSNVARVKSVTGTRAAGGRGLSREDLERLRYAAGSDGVDPQRSLFGPESVTWKVNRETTLLLGGGRALLLQIAHPLVAAGVAEHSNYQNAPLERLWRTLDLTLTMVFGTAADAVRAVRAIERIHSRVHGRLDADVGPFPRGTPYDANEQELLLWVHATLVDSALVAYERFVGELTAVERARYYAESMINARLFGIAAAAIPGTLPEFRRYVREMIRGPILTVGPASRAVAAALLSPPLPFGLRQIAGSTRLFTIGLLPPAIRRRYGYQWGTGRERALRALAAALRIGVPVLPAIARVFPHARRALRQA
jgi:uncharacterized protein (DUF2236 family)